MKGGQAVDGRVAIGGRQHQRVTQRNAALCNSAHSKRSALWQRMALKQRRNNMAATVAGGRYWQRSAA